MNTENNKLIAEFLGFQLQTDPNKRWYNQYFVKDTLEKPYSNRIEILHFDTDWNWLIVAVEKIESMNYYVDIMNKAVSINNDEYMIVDLSGKDFNTKIEAVYTAVVEFIKFYNQTQNTNY
jgi:hypothetical protein